MSAIDLEPWLAAALGAGDAFESVLALDGATYRAHKNRRTFRVTIGDRDCFVKIHGPTSWREILKNGLRGRVPVLTAQPEVAAIRRLRELGVPTVRVVGSGCRGRAPSGLSSFVITETLDGFVHLDDAVDAWRTLAPAVRRTLIRTAIREAAAIARALHGAGLNHRDFYLCHFMLPERDWSRAAGGALDLHVIDLHRVQSRRRTPRRWIAKDLSGLLFSSLDVPVTRTDVLRFLRVYWGENWKRTFRSTSMHRRIILLRAISLYRSDHGRPPPHPGGLASSA